MLRSLLGEKREAVHSGWLEAIVATYPPGAAKFLMRTGEQFGNPVGHTFYVETGRLLDCLVKGDDPGNCQEALLNLVRIRAVQDFSPSQAVAIVFALKGVIRGLFAEKLANNDLATELQAVEDDIDRLALITFDAYTTCREKIFDIRVNEIKARLAILTERMLREQKTLDQSKEETEDNNI